MSASRTDLAAGAYQVEVTNPASPGCPNLIDVVIDIENTLSASANIVTEPTCGQSNGEVTINVTGGSGSYDYDWSDPAAVNQATRNGLASGTYTVTVSDKQAAACVSVVTFTLRDLSLIHI